MMVDGFYWDVFERFVDFVSGPISAFLSGVSAVVGVQFIFNDVFRTMADIAFQERIINAVSLLFLATLLMMLHKQKGDE